MFCVINFTCKVINSPFGINTNNFDNLPTWAQYRGLQSEIEILPSMFCPILIKNFNYTDVIIKRKIDTDIYFVIDHIPYMNLLSLKEGELRIP